MTDNLNLPPFEPKISEQAGKTVVWDPVRRLWTPLTPEEQVRQAFVSYLTNYKDYPLSHIANEQAISLNGMSRRCDSVVYDKAGQPKVIVEYKRPTVTITQKVFDQIARYNLVLHVDYLIVSNGLKHYCVQMEYPTGKYVFLQDIPNYASL
ncbi:MAG: type I restriction enzyme HsdR N-terminal domain-containing protein [Bacteroidaceae bacterium]|nr:type I restriction enzyme HsdR N-terminal domain-containing protein [Bacteroidaceae bacterium]